MQQYSENCPLVSVIVPVYKSEKYFRQCVDSILSQDFGGFELLLIDDGSPDGCPAICDAYEKKDARVRAVHKENGGVSSARNMGIELARGSYIVFADSDDHIGPAYLSEMLNALQSRQTGSERVLILTDYQPFSDSGKEARDYPAEFTVDFRAGNATAQQFRDLVFAFRVFPPYCKLYRKDILDEEQIRFDPVLKSAEDFDFNIRYLRSIDRVCYIPSVQYAYRVGYKKYVPSNHGVLGQSEIKSVHIMANGITSLARRMDVYEELREEIDLWAANKHYFNRLPMLFARSKQIGVQERCQLYRQLIRDPVYHNAYKRGIGSAEKSATRLIGSRFDCFFCWWLFYKMHTI